MFKRFFQKLFDNKDKILLNQIIKEDIKAENKLALFLLFTVIVSAFAVIMMTDSTRKKVIQENDLRSEKETIETEFLNLQLEEVSLTDNIRIENIAKHLKMKRPTTEEEIVIVEE